ncbi:MAG TPA: RtcB family protein, partial [Blastocatellia bacterium]|nr:RtcB family protein [Blastocatellia bacterium]
MVKKRLPLTRSGEANGSSVGELPENLPEAGLSCESLRSFAKTEAALQLGTVGGGNHFVELQSDEHDRLWLMIHTGSRAIGQAVRNHHVSFARGSPLAAL